MQTLYNYGARKFALIGVGQVGCSPSELAQNSPDGSTCVERINVANEIFNRGLISLVNELNQNQPDSRFTYINAYGIFQDVISRPAFYGKILVLSPLTFASIQYVVIVTPIFLVTKYIVFSGFSNTNSGCCGVGRNNGQITCLPFQTPCANRNEHVFWDAFHPTEAANIVIGRRSYAAESPSDSYPYDIRRLAQL